ncbi:Protein FANTASTIC FOUR 3, partial [Mucuna pruriens]
MATIVLQSRIHSVMLPYESPFKDWSSIEALSSVQKESMYVFPKQSSVRLSPKSLEMCTENLGNETGSDMIESDIQLLSSSASSSECGEAQTKTNLNLGNKIRKAREARNFPPPLTTIRGSESIRVRPHREGGRLVLQLTKLSPCFHAQRSHGRLRLCFWTQDNNDPEYQTEDNENELQEQDEEGVDDAAEIDRGWELEYEHTNCIGRNTWRLENNYERLSRCKEGDHDFLINWVATS